MFSAFNFVLFLMLCLISILYSHLSFRHYKKNLLEIDNLTDVSNFMVNNSDSAKIFNDRLLKHKRKFDAYFYHLLLLKLKQSRVYNLKEFLYVLDEENFDNDADNSKKQLLLSVLDNPINSNHKDIVNYHPDDNSLDGKAISFIVYGFLLSILSLLFVDGFLGSIIIIVLVSMSTFFGIIPSKKEMFLIDILYKADMYKELYSSGYIGEREYRDYYDTESLINFLKNHKLLYSESYPSELDDMIVLLEKLSVEYIKINKKNKVSFNKIKDNIIDVLFYHYLSDNKSSILLNSKLKEINSMLNIFFSYNDKNDNLQYQTIISLHNIKKEEYKNKMMDVQ